MDFFLAHHLILHLYWKNIERLPESPEYAEMGPKDFGDLERIEWLFIFRELGSTGNYFQGFGEQAHSFGDLGSTAKK